MDNETAKYIINYFSYLLTDAERMAIKHVTSTYKLQNATSDKTKLELIFRQKGWLTDDQNVLDLLRGGYENFERLVARESLMKTQEKYF